MIYSFLKARLHKSKKISSKETNSFPKATFQMKSELERPLLILMTRWPAANRCKTRLAKDIGWFRAAEIQKRLTNHTIEVAKAIKETGLIEIKLAIETYKHALNIESNNSKIRWNLALAQLLSGDYKEGLKNYVWNFWYH